MNFLSLHKRKLLYFLKKKVNIDKDNKSKSLNLEKLFVKYGSDKASFWNKKNYGHGYTKFYLKHLKKFKKNNINILEIGSYSGASAAAFSKFFYNSNVYCLDINISNFKYYSNKIKVFGLDATNSLSLKNFFKKIDKDKKEISFDIIIDDGSHKLEDILICLSLLFDRLKSKGFYVIEDFMHPNYFKHLDSINEPKIDKLIKAIIKKNIFKSKILSRSFQRKLFYNVKAVNKYKGNKKESHILFLKKK